MGSGNPVTARVSTGPGPHQRHGRGNQHTNQMQYTLSCPINIKRLQDQLHWQAQTITIAILNHLFKELTFHLLVSLSLIVPIFSCHHNAFYSQFPVRDTYCSGRTRSFSCNLGALWPTATLCTAKTYPFGHEYAQVIWYPFDSLLSN